MKSINSEAVSKVIDDKWRISRSNTPNDSYKYFMDSFSFIYDINHTIRLTIKSKVIKTK